MFQLLSLISSGISAWSEQKKAKIDQKTTLEKKKLDRLNNAEMNEAEWDKLMAEASKDSWKDEYWTIILSIPAMLAFFPDMVPHVTAGFQALDIMPDWYKAALGVAIGASFGVKQFTRFKK